MLHVAALSGFIVATSKWQKLWWERGKRARSLARKRKRRQRKCSHIDVQSALRTMSSYDKEQQRLAKQIKRVVLKNIYTLAFCAVRKRAHISNSFNVLRTHCLPSHTFHTSLHVHDRPSQKHVPRLLTVTHTCWFKGQRDARGVYCEYVQLVLLWLRVCYFSSINEHMKCAEVLLWVG